MASTPGPVATAIRAELRRAGMSQSAAARRLGMSQQIFNDRLRGITPFTVEQVYAVAALLDVPVAALMPQPAQPIPV